LTFAHAENRTTYGVHCCRSSARFVAGDTTVMQEGHVTGAQNVREALIKVVQYAKIQELQRPQRF
jgi:hypothetical protein